MPKRPQTGHGWPGWGLEITRSLARDGKMNQQIKEIGADIGAAFLGYFFPLEERSNSPKAKYTGQMQGGYGPRASACAEVSAQDGGLRARGANPPYDAAPWHLCARDCQRVSGMRSAAIAVPG